MDRQGRTPCMGMAGHQAYPLNMVANPTSSLDAQVTVVVVTYNSAHCIGGLARNLNHLPHVVVVDNASTDDTVAQVQRQLPQAQIITSPVNRGFGAANNLALRQIQTPYALLLNPDCHLPPASLRYLVQYADTHPGTAITAPQLVDTRGRPEINYRWPHGFWTSKGPGADGPCCVGFACGACLLLHMDTMHKVGFFDESFFLYYEDDDLCLRTFLARHPLVLLPEAQAVHASRGSVGGRHRWRSEYWRGYHHAQSKLRYTAKHQGLPEAMALRRKVLWLACLALPLRLFVPVPRHVGRLWGRIQGLRHSRLS